MLTDAQGLPILDQFSEEGFVDCIFKVVNLKSDRDFYYFNLLASHEERTLGFAVKLVKEVGPGFDEDMNLIKAHVYKPGVSFRSLGSVSDDLMTTLARLYEIGDQPLRMISEETFTAIALQQQDTDLANCGVKFKLFGRDGEPFDEDAYYESFFNVDFPAGYVSWNEKDPDYRQALIRALALPA